LPHLSEHLTNDLENAIAENEVVIINHRNFDAKQYHHLLKEKAAIIDLVRVPALSALPNYEGICW
jgi:GDP-mannose 6-dehydrogenase